VNDIKKTIACVLVVLIYALVGIWFDKKRIVALEERIASIEASLKPSNSRELEKGEV
jgi:hypothetical protein